MKRYLPAFALCILCAFASFTFPAQQDTYTIVGSWQLIDMEFEGSEGEKTTRAIKETLSQNSTRFVFEETGQFKMVLSADGRGIAGGYLYDAENNILSIKYGSHTDTAIVSWVSEDVMKHASKDGKTRTTMKRVTE